jgi:chromosome segregation ATPase
MQQTYNMDIHDNQSLINKIKYLVAENESLKARVNECEFIAANRQKTIQELKLQMNENSEVRSRLDEQVIELENLQVSIDKIIAFNPGSQQPPGLQNDLRHQLNEHQQQFTYLQTQLSDLQSQLQELKTRNLLLQQQSGRVAELESMLADAEQERDEWKALTKLRE